MSRAAAKRRLRVRRVGPSRRCIKCGHRFYTQHTVDGRVTENYCGGACAWAHYLEYLERSWDAQTKDLSDTKGAQAKEA